MLATICFLTFFGWPGISLKNKKLPNTDTQMLKSLSTDSINFQKDIQPILVRKCSPCHFTGGKMYERLPFDKDTTIINHEAGVLKRINGEENILVKKFFAQKKAHN